MIKRYFTTRIKTDNRNWDQCGFWEVTIRALSVVERTGTHGAPGVYSSTIWENHSDALEWGRQLVEGRLRQGYQEEPEAPSLTGRNITSTPEAIKQRFAECLEEATKGPASGYYINEPASASAIEESELECEIIFPQSVRAFLSTFNGGFVWRRKGTQLDLGNETSKSDEQLKRDVSFPLYSIDEIKSVASNWHGYKWGGGVIPIVDSHNGESLGVWSVRHPWQDSPVFDCFHENSLLQWTVLYPSFAHLFVDYIENQGLIKTGWKFDD